MRIMDWSSDVCSSDLLGTANDFARSVGLRVDDMTACLRLIVNDPATRIALGLLGERPFVNVVTGGFGARVTAEPDPALKTSLGGLALLLTGVRRARAFQPCPGLFRAEGFAWEGVSLTPDIGNGRRDDADLHVFPAAFMIDVLAR